jgi:recombinational DNA repair ATPase RecF
MDIQKAYKLKMAAQLKEWGAQIDLMEAKVANVSADIEVKRANELHDLREKLNSASNKMNEYEKTTGEAWEAIKVTADVIWDDIKTGLAAVHLKFK